MIDQLTAALEGRRFNYDNEAELQIGIAQALREAGVLFQRERQLGQDRIDFFLPLAPPVEDCFYDRQGTGRLPVGQFGDMLSPCDRAGIGVEVKAKGAVSAVTRQLLRYAYYDEVTELVLLTTRHQHGQVPREMNGKRVQVIFLGEETC